MNYQKLQRFSFLTIPNLTLILVILIAAVNGFALVSPEFFSVFATTPVFGISFWPVIFWPFRLTQSWISLLFYLYLIFVIGKSLEVSMGDLAYTLYVLTGIVFVTVGSIWFPISAVFIYMSIFLAVAHLQPDQELLLFFILPMKYRILAIIAVVYMMIDPVLLSYRLGAIWPMLGPVLGFANYIFFFALPTILQKSPASRSARFQRKVKAPASIHHCTVCNRTENDDPNLDFRYCVQCSNHEYCTDHLHNHSHIQD